MRVDSLLVLVHFSISLKDFLLRGSRFDLTTLFSSLEWFEQANCATLFTTHSSDYSSMDDGETGREERMKSTYIYILIIFNLIFNNI